MNYGNCIFSINRPNILDVYIDINSVSFILLVVLFAQIGIEAHLPYWPRSNDYL